MLLTLLTALAPSDEAPEIRALLAFTEPATTSLWRPVHDSVMGGVSNGRATAGGAAARLAGTVSLDNNGGFASFRIDAELPDLAAFDGLRLRVRGDGQNYKLSLRTDGRWDGVSWQVPFATVADEWTTVHLAFDDLAPSWRGRLVGGLEPFDGASIRQIGVVIADKQVGPFAIDVESIDAWRAVESPRPAGTRRAALDRTAALAAAIDGGASTDELLAALRMEERLLVVASPRQLGPEASIQMGRFTALDADLAARELRLVHLMGDGAARIAGRTLSSEQTRALRAEWNLPTGDWTAALVGKDGGVKVRWSEPIEPTEVFARIDAMPMRASEVRTRRAI